MLSPFKALMNQTINVATKSGRDSSGDPSYGTAADVSAYVEKRRGIVELPTGEKVETSHWIVVESEIKLSDRVWLPGDSTSDPSLAYTPASVEAFVDDVGNAHHYEVTLY